MSAGRRSRMDGAIRDRWIPRMEPSQAQRATLGEALVNDRLRMPTWQLSTWSRIQE